MFVGTFEHSLDDKGRVVLPAAYRPEFTDRGYLSQFDRCLALWTPEEFDDMSERLTERVRAKEATQGALRAFAANSHLVRADSQGRISIPERLREFAGLDRDVMVVGALNKVEVWDRARWQSERDESDQSLAMAITELGL